MPYLDAGALVQDPEGLPSRTPMSTALNQGTSDYRAAVARER